MEKKKVGPLIFQLDLSLPIYEQVMKQIKLAVARGEVELGTKIPSVRELAQQLKINPSTVVRAYLELERDGLCEKRRGQGTYITTSPERVLQVKKGLAADAITSFVETMKALGVSRETAEQWIKEAKW
ncbi:GntR family transcriptional regulator [Paenactinomyces guangxiensis]|uniref:GntR family transcriptional regulator n=1 Tax=Paenactinomyces guangxiensis TaxID=1490290 RepID=A0A7W1WQ74_9BACL|nr:GntR family transcriptional regulator [Paenactinomyces guangxiensis]MBA4493888.1 GntR family transcriptional regulator [Paenactinomyces guangxiensis]MBH8591354.1 GntR family transcriptional regulator [Paenactinomyces guangxiensis]